MNQQQRISPQDWQLLSAYLDGQLSDREKTRLEKRLSEQADLRTALDELRQTRALLRSVRMQRVPRNFTLTPAMVEKPRRSWLMNLVPVLNFASAAATVAVVVMLAVTLLPGRGLPMQTAAQSTAAAESMPMSAAGSEPTPVLQWNAPGGMGGGADPLMEGKGGGDGNDMRTFDTGPGQGFILPPQAVESLPEGSAEPQQKNFTAPQPALTATPAPSGDAAPPAAPAPAAETGQPQATPVMEPSAAAAQEMEAPQEPLSGAGPILGVQNAAEAEQRNMEAIGDPYTAESSPQPSARRWIAPAVLALFAVISALAAWLIRRKSGA